MTSSRPIAGARTRGALPRPISLVILAFCTLTQCVCQNTREDRPAAAGESRPVATSPTTAGADAQAARPATGPALPAWLDVKDLDAAEREILLQVFSEQFDPCGAPRSFLESLHDPKRCERATTLANQTVALVGQGLSKKQVVRELLKELQRTAVKAEFDFTGSPRLGDPKAKHVVVEFTDYQCPYCRAASGPLKELVAGSDAVLYVKHLPLDIHPMAREAAVASLAAARQDKFWALNDLLYENQKRLTSQVIRELAQQAGLDMARFEADMKDPQLVAVLARDLDEANRFKVDGTPTFFLNGTMVELPELEDKLAE